MQKSGPKLRRGVSMIYMCCAMAVLCGFISFAVDLGRVQLAKTQLQSAADAAARAAAIKLIAGGSTAQVRTEAQTWASANPVDAGTVTLTNADIEIGRWASGAFSTSGSPKNAVRITANKLNSRGTAIPLTFSKVLGRSTLDVKAVSTAYAVAAINTTSNPKGTDNPWLSGTPDGTVANPGNYANNPDYAPAQRPTPMAGLTLTAGQILTFNSITGDIQYGPGKPVAPPDGDPNYIISNLLGNENGIADLKAPITSLIAVFMDNTSPIGKAPPPILDFTSPASRDFATLSPQLRQPFFVGDGLRSNGTVQQFIVPAGATRLMLGTMDGCEWNNNQGTRTVQINKPAKVSLVK